MFDDQDSGNICFGMQKGEKRYSVKCAGAPTQRGSIAPVEAVKRLKSAGVLYRELRHENLIPLEEDYNGFVPLL
ncbi:MAG: hypothetical protein HFH84_17055 [Lachnospiraceae bacterium]|nr:hypothetical protein [Lachnospiraceae bacterium]